MKWKTRIKKKKPDWGTERKRIKFFLLPKSIDGITYWLERQVVIERYGIKSDGFGGLESGWYIKKVLVKR